MYLAGGETDSSSGVTSGAATASPRWIGRRGNTAAPKDTGGVGALRQRTQVRGGEPGVSTSAHPSIRKPILPKPPPSHPPILPKFLSTRKPQPTQTRPTNALFPPPWVCHKARRLGRRSWGLRRRGMRRGQKAGIQGTCLLLLPPTVVVTVCCWRRPLLALSAVVAVCCHCCLLLPPSRSSRPGSGTRPSRPGKRYLSHPAR